VPFAAVLSLAPMLTATASDYSHMCRTADGLYEMNDGQLVRAGTPDQNIDYTVLGEILIRGETGYCTSNKAGSQRFGYESKSYVQRIRFSDQGQPVETAVICELISDGLPAAYTCDKQTVTSRQGAGAGKVPAQPASKAATLTPGQGASFWLHNGSVVTLEADGESRRFIYHQPREGVAKAGAKAGSILFQGIRSGDSYSGTAYLFSLRCGPQSYEVSGKVSADQRLVTLSGQAPVLGKDCRVRRQKTDTLEFRFMPELGGD
jgi:hypothetical protein